MVIGAVSTYPAEALIEALMSDDRVGRRPQHYIDVVSEEIASSGKVSQGIWVKSAGVISHNEDWRDLESAIRMVAYSGASYTDRSLFQIAKAPPFQYCTGDRRANLDNLKRGPPPSQPAALKIYNLLQLGWHSMNELSDLLELLSQLHWSTNLAEQTHAGVATVKRYHGRMGVAMIVMRSFAWSIAPLLRCPMEDKYLARLKKKSTALLRKHPAKSTGYHVVHRGGRWTAEHRGVAWDSVRGETTHDNARDFWKLYGLCKSGTFSRTIYGDSWAAELALRWCCGMEHYYSIWAGTGFAPDFTFDASHDYIEAPNFVAKLAGVAPNTPLRRRLQEVRDMRPRAPRGSGA